MDLRVKQETSFTFFLSGTDFFFFMCMTNIITLFSGHTIKFENGLDNLGYNSRTVYTILKNDTPKDAYENCLQGLSTIFQSYGSKVSPFLLLITE